MTFQSLRDALLILATLPFCAIGGVLALAVTGTPFSISAAVGFASIIGVATLGGVVFLSGIREGMKRSHVVGGIERGALAEMRAVMMACTAAGLGLLAGRAIERASALRPSNRSHAWSSAAW